MNPVQDPAGIAEGRALLAQLPGLYVAAFKSTQLEREAENEVRCSFELPVFGKRTRTAHTAREAIHALLLELSDALTQIALHEWTSILNQRALSSKTLLASPSGPSGLEDEKEDRFQSKARQFTVGVTLPVALKKSLQGIAEEQGASFAVVARQLVTVGFEDFDNRIFAEASKKLLSELVSEVDKWFPSDTEQIMLRLEPPLAVRLRSSAKEYKKSASEFGVMCLAHGLVLQQQLVELEAKVAAYRGAAARKLAPKVGLGTHVTLLSGVLAGSIHTPTKVLKRLTEVFDVKAIALSEFFRRSCESRAVPAFKAENGKPQVTHRATSWEDAVKSLNLPAEQAKKLLQLDE